MMAMAFLAGFMVGAVVVLAAAALVCMTPREVINIIKEERSRNGRQLLIDQGSGNHRQI